MTARVELRLDGQMDQLRLAWQVGETLLTDVPFDRDADDTRFQILVAMQELLTNVFRHGYRNQTGIAEIRFAWDEHAFEFQIRDRAPQFDPTRRKSRPESEVDQDRLVQMKEGGYGISIVNEVMDECEYFFEDGWNILKATKLVRSALPVGASGDPS